ncbi:hypothetical protein Hsw_1808 [Hymenobacter swuensis DY53]|uniref:Uncharacterized protein n=1 Tax=Hymenobacter swuensis DY53 TaxID=1227739 RepID=W8EXU9_9BACT|nr:hypothetical protein Hsw_1808 [Hymenobacter swuensis DY53]
MVGLFATCQPKKATTTQRAASVLPPPPLPPSRLLPIPPPVPAPLPDQELTRFLQQYAVAPLLQSVRNTQEVVPYNGFFGSDRHRIEVVLLRVRPDATQPRRLLVTAKSRFKGKIQDLQGVIELTALQRQPALNKAEQAYEKQQEAMRMMTVIRLPNAEKAVGYYTLTGNFDWREVAGAGRFAGRAVLDVAVTDQQGLWSASLRKTAGARGADLLFDGQWTSGQMGLVKPFILVENVTGFAEHVLQDFEVGERDIVINPKYARLGWDSYWENEEWWAEPTKAAAHATAIQ